MTRSDIRNIAASVRARLTNRARASGDEFQLVVRRYFYERFLARLAASEARDRFVLKGAMLFQLWADQPYRATADLDLLYRGSADHAKLERELREILVIDVDEDGVTFDADGIESENIRAADEYAGVRVHFIARLGTIRDRLQVDIGIADSVWPPPQKSEYRTLLGSDPPSILTYSRESVIAEKFEAMILLGMTNTRIKDFFDIHYLASTFAFEGISVAEAMRRTLTARKTKLPVDEPAALTEEFWTYVGRPAQIRAFARRTRLVASLEHATRMLPLLRSFLLPPFEAIRAKKNFVRKWSPGGPWKR